MNWKLALNELDFFVAVAKNFLKIVILSCFLLGRINFTWVPT